MCRPCLARTNHYEDPAELAKAVARLRAQGFKERRKREAPMPGEFIVGEKLDSWGNVVATVQWRAHEAPLPFFADVSRPSSAAPARTPTTAAERETSILTALSGGSKTRSDLLFELRKIGGEKSLEDALRALVGRGEVFARSERHGRHRFFRVESAAV